MKVVEFCQKEIEIIESRVKRCDEKIPACKKKRHSWKYFPEHNPGIVSKVLSCEHCGVIKKKDTNNVGQRSRVVSRAA